MPPLPMERQASSRFGALEKLRSFKLASLDKQHSFKSPAVPGPAASIDRLPSFRERKHKDSPGKRGDTELHLVARAGNTARLLGILYDSGGTQLLTKQNSDGETPLYLAAENGHADAVREILAVSDVNSASVKANNSFDAFHIAAKLGHLEVVKVMLEALPALAMTTNSVNATALDTAATQGHVGIVDLLLETDLGLTRIARNNGKTALHSAARMGHVAVVRSLLEKDPSIGLRTDKKGQTALHMAVKGQNVDIVLELLNQATAVNVADNKGNRPLHVAVRKGNAKMVTALLGVDGIEMNAANKAGETALAMAEKEGSGGGGDDDENELSAILRAAGAAREASPSCPAAPATAKQLKQTVSDIKHDVQSQLRQTRRTDMRVLKIRRKLQKLHIGGLNNAINSNTVVAVLIATVAFAAIFQVPGQFVGTPVPDGYELGQAYVAHNAAFLIFLISDALALFISLAVVVVQTSLIVVEQSAKRKMVFVMNKLMWLACLFISVAFVSLTYVVVGKGRGDEWLAWSTLGIGAVIMLTTIGAMGYCVIVHRIDEKNKRSIRRTSTSRSQSWPVPPAASVAAPGEAEDAEQLLDGEFRKIYAL